MRGLINSFYAAFIVAGFNPLFYCVTIVSGLIWRFSMILGYVCSIQFLAMAFSAHSSMKLVEINVANTAIALSYNYIAVLIVLLFLLSALFDVLFTLLRGKLEELTEIRITSLIKSRGATGQNLTLAKKTYASQILMKSFDLIFSFLLIFSSIIILLLVNPTLGLILFVLGIIAYLAMWLQKQKYHKVANKMVTKGSSRRIRAQKLIRSAKIRATSTFAAGIFLAIAVKAVEYSWLGDIGLVELAISAFCARFFVSFFTMFYINLNACSDNRVLINEFISLAKG